MHIHTLTTTLSHTATTLPPLPLLQPTVQTHRRRLDLYRAAVKLLDSQSGVSQAAKASRVPFLQEKILAMELGHANTVWADEVMNK